MKQAKYVSNGTITYAIKGEQGPAGPQGPKGEQGPAGPQGPKGDAAPSEIVREEINKAIDEGKITNVDLDKELSEILKKQVAITLSINGGLSTATITQTSSTLVTVNFPSDNTSYYCYKSKIDSVSNLLGKDVIIEVKNIGTSNIEVPNRICLSKGPNWGNKLAFANELGSGTILAGATEKYRYVINDYITDNSGDIYLVVGSEKMGTELNFTISVQIQEPNNHNYYVQRAESAKTSETSVYAEVAGSLGEPSKTIACFGDSLTQGAPVYGNKSYPGKLQTLLGSDYVVESHGIGGETAQGILARQGAYPAVVSPFTIPSDTTEVSVTLKSSIDGSNIRWQNGVVQARVNPVSIAGIKGNLTVTIDSENDSYNYTFARLQEGDEVVLTRPSLLNTNSGENRKDAIQILWIGQNGTWSTPDELVEMYKAAIRHLTTDRYICIGLSSSTKSDREVLERKMSLAFGERYLNIREYLVTYGLDDAGLTPTSEDESQIAQGLVPVSLRADSVHFTEAGYTVIANVVYKLGKYLGYWQ